MASLTLPDRKYGVQWMAELQTDTLTLQEADTVLSRMMETCCDDPSSWWWALDRATIIFAFMLACRKLRDDDFIARGTRYGWWVHEQVITNSDKFYGISNDVAPYIGTNDPIDAATNVIEFIDDCIEKMLHPD